MHKMCELSLLRSAVSDLLTTHGIWTARSKRRRPTTTISDCHSQWKMLKGWIYLVQRSSQKIQHNYLVSWRAICMQMKDVYIWIGESDIHTMKTSTRRLNWTYMYYKNLWNTMSRTWLITAPRLENNWFNVGKSWPGKPSYLKIVSIP